MNRNDLYSNLRGAKASTPKRTTSNTSVVKKNEGQIQSAPVPVLKKNEDIISQYEAIPNYNFLERAFDAQKQLDYQKKADMLPEYQAAKGQQIEDILFKNGISRQNVVTSKMGENAEWQRGIYNLLGQDTAPLDLYAKVKDVAEKNGLTYRDVYDYVNGLEAKKTNESLANFAEKHPTLGTGLSFVTNPMGGILGATTEAANYLTGKPIGSNEVASQLANTTGDIRKSVRDNIDSGVGQFAYDVGTSIGDMGTAALVGGKPLSLGLMGTSAGVQSLNEQMGKNTSQDQKVATALTSGLIEVLTEKLPLDNLFKMAEPTAKQTFKTIAKNILKQAGSEASEEAVSEIANTVADYMYNKGQSDYALSVDAYMKQGMDENSAKLQATIDVAKNVGMSALAGGVSGGIMAGGAQAIGRLRGGNVETKKTESNNDFEYEPLDADKTGIEKPVSQFNEASKNIQDMAESLLEPISDDSNNTVDNSSANENKVPEIAPKMTRAEVEQQNLANALSTDASAKKITGFDELNKDLRKLVGMYGNEDVKAMYEKMNGLINEFISTGNNEYMLQAMEIASEMDIQMQGAEYTFKNTKTKNSVKSQNKAANNKARYEDGRLVETLFGDMKAIENEAQKNASVPTVETQTAQGEPVENIAAEQRVPELTVEMPKAESKAEAPKVEQTARPDIKDGMVDSSITSRNTYTKSNVFNRFEESKKWLKSEIAQGTYKVDYVSEEKSMYKAAEFLDEDYQREYDKIIKDEVLDQYQVDESMMILDDMVSDAVNTGDWSKVREFSKAVNDKIHRMGQGLQALAKHSRTAVSAIMKTEQLGKALGKDIEISDNDMLEVKRLFDEADKYGEFSKQREELERTAYAILAKYLPDASFSEKWNSWRYLAMLGNTRTHIRNIFGNVVFGAVTDIKDQLAGAIESAVISDPEQRTKSAGLPSSELLKASKADADNVWTLLTGDGEKFNMKSAIEGEKRIFKLAPVEAMRDLNSRALTAEDNFALVRKYKNALASYLNAQGADASIFNSENESDIKLLDEARRYAINQAQIATFHEDNQLANILNNWAKYAKNKGGVAGKSMEFLIESLVPFKKTPANILKQGVVEYNPAQIVKGLYDVAKHGDNPAKAIDEVARGLTGSAIMALGYYLAQKGILRGKGNEEDKKIDAITGEQDFSVNVNGKSYTIDWLAPAALPLFVGAELEKVMRGEDIDAMTAFSTIADPIVEMSMLQGLQNALSSAASAATGKSNLMETAYNIGYGYASQAVPTIMGQVARSVDDTRRSTYTGKSDMPDTIQKSWEKIENKIPFLSKTNEAYINPLGHTQENAGGSFLGRLAYNMLSPGYASDTTKTEMENELYRLNKEMANGKIEKSNIVPDVAEKSYDGEKLSPEEYSRYATIKGQNAEKILNETISSDYYKGLDDEGKASVLSRMLKFSNAMSKSDAFGYDVANANDYKKPYKFYEDKGIEGVMNFYNIHDLQEGQSQADIIDAIEKAGISDADKAYYFKNIKGSDIEKKGQLLEMTNDKYMYDYYKLQSQYGSKKDELEFGVLRSDLPDEEKRTIIGVIEMKKDEVEFNLLRGRQ